MRAVRASGEGELGAAGGGEAEIFRAERCARCVAGCDRDRAGIHEHAVLEGGINVEGEAGALRERELGADKRRVRLNGGALAEQRAEEHLRRVALA